MEKKYRITFSDTLNDYIRGRIAGIIFMWSGMSEMGTAWFRYGRGPNRCKYYKIIECEPEKIYDLINIIKGQYKDAILEVEELGEKCTVE